jgi:hypothetical protein
MLREDITDKDALGHCRLLLQISKHYQAYMASKPYIPYASVVKIVDAVEVMQQYTRTQP